ncbi:MAG: uroporphyrinogen-III C-methyltransferase, partial [Janibacter sp.]|nr:uroporphyrinogen-III C-methyltransferase [Janibacter sp.]
MTDATPTPTGRVLLVGGGPGDPGLLTVSGRDALIAADVVVTDRLAPIAAIAEHAPQAEVIHVGKIPRGEFTPQERINELLVEHARAGKVVVRLKGGDGYLFGRGGEEWQHCIAAGIPVEIVPGVSSAFSVPALAGIPVTHRGLSQGVAVVSGHVAPEDPRSEVDWAALATSRLTIVILMGVATLGSIAEALIAAGLPADTPA